MSAESLKQVKEKTRTEDPSQKGADVDAAPSTLKDSDSMCFVSVEFMEGPSSPPLHYLLPEGSLDFSDISLGHSVLASI